MRKTNYHTHTYRCGHAKGSEEEMILAGIEIGLEEIGICCHVPLPYYRKHLLKALKDVRDVKSLGSLLFTFVTQGPTMRMTYKECENHLKKIDDCKNKYMNQIKVFKGFEAEGFEEYFDYYQTLLSDNKVDYLILGHHFHKYCIHKNYFGKRNLSREELYLYCEDVEKALETGLFSCLAHPDLFLLGYHDFGNDMQIVTKRICKKAKELNIPLELNAGGIRRGLKEIKGEKMYLYPNHSFWSIVSKVGNDVIIGIDAHDPKDLNNEMYEFLETFAKKYQLRLIDSFKFLKGKVHKMKEIKNK